MVSIPILLFSGFFISLDSIPPYLKWLSYLSYIRYSYQSVLLAIYSMNRLELHCDKIFCPFQEPMDFLKEMDMIGGNLYVDYAALLGFFAFFRFVAYIVLWYRIVYSRWFYSKWDCTQVLLDCMTFISCPIGYILLWNFTGYNWVNFIYCEILL